MKLQITSTKELMMKKIDTAKQIVACHPNASRQELIALFMTELSMSKAGATTYYYNATRGLQATTKTTAAIAAIKTGQESPTKLSGAQLMKMAEKKSKTSKIVADLDAKEAARLKQREEVTAELARIEADLDGYVWDKHGILVEKTAPTAVKRKVKAVDAEATRVEAIKDRNLEMLKEVSARRKGGNYIVC
jgi:hypothetical protein